MNTHNAGVLRPELLQLQIIAAITALLRIYRDAFKIYIIVVDITVGQVYIHPDN